MSSIALLTILLATGADPQADSLVVESALLSAVEEADIAAREAGAIVELKMRRGETIEREQLLAQIDDADAVVATEQAAIELAIARDEAKNDIKIRHAQKTLDVAKAELNRAAEAVKKYPQSISEGEMDRLRLTIDRDALAVEQSQHEHRIAQATVRLKENIMKLASLRLARRTVVAPFDGIVAEVSRARGEWVEPGDTVARLLRIDRLRAEAFVNASDFDAGLLGRAVRLSVTTPGGGESSYEGEVVFVSPEIDPVNGQLLVWAEIDNTELTLRPGQRGTLTIELSAGSAVE